MRFKGLDLNLLGAFQVLMEVRSVSRAAGIMNLSQPAMSAALSRLREFFADPLLVPEGKAMHPTPFAESLLPQVTVFLGGIDAMLSSSSKFDPANASRTFRVITSDYVITSLLVPVLERMSSEAPNIRIEMAAPSDTSESQIAEGRADLLITPDVFLQNEHPAELLLEETHVIVGWAENPSMRVAFGVEEMLAAGYVGVRMGARRVPAFADRQMSTMGYDRRIEVETSSFLTIPPLVCGTGRLAIMHGRLADSMEKIYPLRQVPLPIPFPPMREMMKFHRARVEDEGLAWLRRLLREEASACSPK
ncbi:LysR substrate-binding domain-containing protein [Sphingomonas sp. CLY1604]|uniref:LysR substrate-binding domain-containing protein n=1 Tax=Sphingomonas sp. CLY1604 TaxID=3457786 RepID=UPI003FD8A039